MDALGSSIVFHSLAPSCELCPVNFAGGRRQNLHRPPKISTIMSPSIGIPEIIPHHSCQLSSEMAEDTSKAPSPSSLSGSPSATPINDSAATGYDPNARWTNYFNILTNRMTDDGKNAFREDAYIRNEAADCKRCDDYKDFLFKYSPIVRFMSQNITGLNGKLNEENVRCQRCVTRVVMEQDGDGNMVQRYKRQGGGFSPDHGILICANEIRNRGHMEDTLAHEMVHAYDHLRFKVDWSDLRHAACTEVRLYYPKIPGIRFEIAALTQKQTDSGVYVEW